MHQVRAQRQHAVALAAGEAGDAELHLLEVAEAAVDQLRRSRGGAGGDVAALDQEDLQPALGGVERDAAAGDAAADDHEIELASSLAREAARHCG